MSLEIIISFLLSLGIIILLRKSFGLLVLRENTPSCSLCLIVRIEGNAPDLDAAVKRAKYISDNNTRIILVDAGMDDETTSCAVRLAQIDNLEICPENQLCDLLKQ